MIPLIVNWERFRGEDHFPYAPHFGKISSYDFSLRYNSEMKRLQKLLAAVLFAAFVLAIGTKITWRLPKRPKDLTGAWIRIRGLDRPMLGLVREPRLNNASYCALWIFDDEVPAAIGWCDDGMILQARQQADASH